MESPDEKSNRAGIVFTSTKKWESWLADHWDEPDGLWLLIAKKGSPKPSITIGEALDVALCFGWIDSQRKACDADYYLQRYSPRRSKIPWSRRNVERVAALIRARRMRKPGLLAIAAAKADGRWDAAYAAQGQFIVPRDFAAALKQNQKAQTAFDKLSKTDKYIVVLPLLKTTTPTMRRVRLLKTIAQLASRK